jgi:hypothetical protein
LKIRFVTLFLDVAVTHRCGAKIVPDSMCGELSLQ